MRVLTGWIWRGIRTSGGLLRTWLRNFGFRNRQRISLSTERHVVFQEQLSSVTFVINSSVHTFTVAIDVLIVQSQQVLHSTCNRMPDWVALPRSRMLRTMHTLQRTYSGRNCTVCTPPWNFPLVNWKPYLLTAQTTMRNMRRGRPGKMQNISMLVICNLYRGATITQSIKRSGLKCHEGR